MKHGPGKTIALLGACVAMALLIGAGFALRGRILERYYLFRLGAKDEGARRAAAEWLGEMRSVKAIPLLIAGLRSPVLRETCSLALARIGSPSVMPLSELLKDEYPPLRDVAAETLGAIGPAAKEAIPALIQALRNQDPVAARALGKVRPEAAARELLRATTDRSPRSRLLAFEILGMLRHVGPAVLPSLIEALADEDFRVRCSSISALARFGPQAKDAVPALIGALHDEYYVVRTAAANALGAIGPDARAAAPALTDVLQEAESEVRKAAAEALKGIRGE